MQASSSCGGYKHRGKHGHSISVFIRTVDISHGELLKGEEGRAEQGAVARFSSIRWRKGGDRFGIIE